MTVTACLTGRSREHLVSCQGHLVHRDALDDFCLLESAARAAGFALTIASGFRDFDRQLAIWNGKYQGQRPVYDKTGATVNMAQLDDLQKCHAILLYSALPGASRHHWGCDLDIYDGNAVSEDYRLALSPDEYAPQGPFGPLTRWLDENLTKYGFYRPYDKERGGVAPEPWHISHIETAARCQQALTLERLREALENSHIAGRSVVIENLPQLFQRYVSNVAPAPKKRT